MKKYKVWLQSGESEIIETKSVPVVSKTNSFLRVKIGSRVINNVIAFTQASEPIIIKK